MKLIPYIIMIAMGVGVFLYVKNIGVAECESKQKTEIIKQVQKDVGINKRQSDIRAMRSSYDLSYRLQSGTF